MPQRHHHLPRLPRRFYNRNVLEVARDLLGMALVRRMENGHTVRARIVETEAYGGPRDRASHAYRGKTLRNAAMFGSPGHAYIYFTYGMHWLLNVVAEPAGDPAAVLIRGVDVLEQLPSRLSGPARVTKYLQISGSLNAEDLVRSPHLWIERSQDPRGARRVTRTPRIGVDYAGAAARWHRRFLLL